MVYGFIISMFVGSFDGDIKAGMFFVHSLVAIIVSWITNYIFGYLAKMLR